MISRSSRIQQLLRLVGDPSRFAIVRALWSGDRCVTELAAEVGLSQSCTTRHLQALEGARIVSGARAGKRVMYSLERADPLVGELVTIAAETSLETPPAPGSRRRKEPSEEAPVRAEAAPGPLAPHSPHGVSRSEIEDYLL